jgi:Tol biopolymer transport system component
VSSNGRLVLLTTATRNKQLTWLDRHGNNLNAIGEPGVYGNLDLSPDGKRVAVDRLIRPPGAEPLIDIWLIDLATGAATPLTDDPAADYDPAWSPDGKYIIFNSNRPVKVRSALFVRPANGSGVDTLVAGSDTYSLTVADWSPTTHDLIFNGFNDTDAGDLLTLSLSGDRTPRAFVRSKHAELHGAFSPDGRWVAYQSNASGRYEVIVRSFPDGEMAHTISRDGGMCARWREDGKELFFLGQDGTMMAAGIDPTDGSSMGVHSLFPTALITGNSRPYAVTPDGERFLLPIAPDAQLNVVMDWRALLPR